VAIDAAQEAPRPREERFAYGVSARVTPLLVAAVPIASLAATQGGYFPTTWGWVSLPLLWVVGVVLVARPSIRLSRAERILIAALAGLTAWLAVSTVWSVAPAETVLEVERMLVYLAGVTTVLLVARSQSVRRVLAGVFIVITGVSAFSLTTRLFPDRVGVFDRTAVYRLSQPIGYWNGLALFVVIGILLALGFAARGQTIVGRAASAAAIVLLLPTFYFTFGRAGWVALAVGLAAAVWVDPRRLQLLATFVVVMPAATVGTWLASRQSGLTRSGSGLAQAAHDGHRLALMLLGLALVSAIATAIFVVAERRVSVSPHVRAAFGAAALLTLVLAVGAVFVRYGGPTTLTRKAYDAFKAPPPHSTNLNRRLLSFSGNGRADLWRLAWDDARNHPWLGSGPGTYERYYLAHQPAQVGRVRDAHGLYIETLAELGPLGLGLLLVVFAVPLVALATARRHPLVPFAAGAYVAFLVHSGVDWDWELPALTLVGITCGAAILIAGRAYARPKPLSPLTRWGGVAASVVVAVFAAIGLVGNSALGASNSARTDGDWARAVADARKARQWMPWSPAPWSALGLAQLGSGLVPEARASFDKALSMDSGDWKLWYNLARASSGRARVHALRHAVALFPRSGLRADLRREVGTSGG
jgi:O-antigen ligase/polysaccharide polymerase Wzy-like membrane protein